MIRLLLLTEPVEPDANGSIRAPEGTPPGTLGATIEYATAEERDVRLDQAIASMKLWFRDHPEMA